MKSIWFTLLTITVIVLLVSCQKEERELIDNTEDTTIPRDSQLALLMKNVVTHDGSFDDVVDKGNCYSIDLPYSIFINEEEVLIDDPSDYQKIVETDVIKIQFPIRITLSDHSSVTIDTKSELEEFSSMCKVEDDDIECVDFVYPIDLKTFESDTNRFRTIEVQHDSEMFEFMENSTKETKISINYPIDLVSHNGQNITALHNSDFFLFNIFFILLNKKLK